LLKYSLIITEKPSVARQISAVLNAKERKDGFFIGNGYIVSWCAGHLLELAAPDAYGEQYTKCICRRR
jgi:DNA topoisomerase-3